MSVLTIHVLRVLIRTFTGGASLPSKLRLPPMKTVRPIRSQPPAWQWRYQEMTVRPQMPSSSQIQWDCYKKWKVEWEAQTGMRRWSTSTFENSCGCTAGVKGNDRAARLASKATLTSGLLLGRSEVLRNLRHYLQAQSQGSREWHKGIHWSPGGERLWKRKR